jgi:hypothetical protein
MALVNIHLEKIITIAFIIHPTRGIYYYKSTSALHGKIIITKDDRFNDILSGTFEINVVNTSNPSDIVIISSGRFEIKNTLKRIIRNVFKRVRLPPVEIYLDQYE